MTKDTKEPDVVEQVWGYRKTKDGVEAQLVDCTNGKLPTGWKDTPAGMED